MKKEKYYRNIDRMSDIKTIELLQIYIDKQEQYCEGNRVRHLTKFVNVLCRYGVSENYVLPYLKDKYQDHRKKQLKQIIKSEYKKGNFGSFYFRSLGKSHGVYQGIKKKGIRIIKIKENVFVVQRKLLMIYGLTEGGCNTNSKWVIVNSSGNPLDETNSNNKCHYNSKKEAEQSIVWFSVKAIWIRSNSHLAPEENPSIDNQHQAFEPPKKNQ